MFLFLPPLWRHSILLEYLWCREYGGIRSLRIKFSCKREAEIVCPSSWGHASMYFLISMYPDCTEGSEWRNDSSKFQALTVGDKGCEALLQAHLRLEGTGAASGVAGVVEASGGRRYLLLEGHHGDLHAYVRARRRLREPEARRLFRQAARAVATCHEYGVVLRDLKLRKFVFADETR